MITGWRKAWGQGDFPFHFVQLANYKALQVNPGDTSRFAEIREAQRHTLRLKNTAMAVIIDIGQADDIHPVNKWDVGRRLALPALHKVYARAGDSAHSGPRFDTCFSRGATVRIRFAHAHGGLKPKAEPLKGFALSGADGIWHWASPTVRNDTVDLNAAAVPVPLKVRYAYASNPIGNLFNGVDLPASPFEETVPKEASTVITRRGPTRLVVHQATTDLVGRILGKGGPSGRLRFRPSAP